MYLEVLETILEKLVSTQRRLVLFIQNRHSMTCRKLQRRQFRFTFNLRCTAIPLLTCERGRLRRPVDEAPSPLCVPPTP